eukprot:3143142-Amphidinium_carterae.1
MDHQMWMMLSIAILRLAEASCSFQHGFMCGTRGLRRPHLRLTRISGRVNTALRRARLFVYPAGVDLNRSPLERPVLRVPPSASPSPSTGAFAESERADALELLALVNDANGAQLRQKQSATPPNAAEASRVDTTLNCGHEQSGDAGTQRDMTLKGFGS